MDRPRQTSEYSSRTTRTPAYGNAWPKIRYRTRCVPETTLKCKAPTWKNMGHCPRATARKPRAKSALHPQPEGSRPMRRKRREHKPIFQTVKKQLRQPCSNHTHRRYLPLTPLPPTFKEQEAHRKNNPLFLRKPKTYPKSNPKESHACSAPTKPKTYPKSNPKESHACSAPPSPPLTTTHLTASKLSLELA